MQNQDMSMEEILASIRKIISEDKRPEDGQALNVQAAAGIPESHAKHVNGHHPSLPGHTPVLNQDFSDLSKHSDVLELNQKIQEDGSIKILEKHAQEAFSYTNAPHGVIGASGTSPNGIHSSYDKNSAPLMSSHAYPSMYESSAPSPLGEAPRSSMTSRGRAQPPLPPVPSAARASSARETFERHHPVPPQSVTSDSFPVKEKQENTPETLSFEEMVQKTLRPILFEWLNEYLPKHLPAHLDRVVREHLQLMMRK